MPARKTAIGGAIKGLLATADFLDLGVHCLDFKRDAAETELPFQLARNLQRDFAFYLPAHIFLHLMGVVLWSGSFISTYQKLKNKRNWIQITDHVDGRHLQNP